MNINNNHTVHGRLVRDPEYVRAREEKNDRTKFTVAVDRRYGDETDYIDCVVFGKLAAVIDKWFSKGSEIMASGEGQIRSYDDKNGIRRKAYTVVVSDFSFCGSKSDNGSNTQQTTTPATTPAPTPATTQTTVPEQTDEPAPDGFEQLDEDIPF